MNRQNDRVVRPRHASTVLATGAAIAALVLQGCTSAPPTAASQPPTAASQPPTTSPQPPTTSPQPQPADSPTAPDASTSEDRDTTASPTDARQAPRGDRDRPGPSTTGADSDLAPSDGRIIVDEDGAVVEGIRTTGPIDIKADDVTVRNVHIEYEGDAYAIRTYDGFSGTSVEDVTIELLPTDDGRVPNAGIQGGENITVRRTEITGAGDGIKASPGSVYEDNWIHLARPPGSDKHLDAIQGGVSDLVIRRNFLDVPNHAGGNAAYINTTFDDDPPRNIVISDNWLNGGNYTLYVGRTKEGDFMENVRITGNVFGPDVNYGYILNDDDPNIVTEDNVMPPLNP